jgi:hypothetical protein
VSYRRACSSCTDHGLGCISETHRDAFDFSFADHDPVALLDVHASWSLTEVRCELEATPLLRSGIPLVTSLPESGLPGASTPQHLPPLGFLNPSTVCSSEQLACLVSYRHHLWDSKSGTDSPGNMVRLGQVDSEEPSPPWSRHAWTTRATVSLCEHVAR